jgi:hypothetical protein
MRRTAVFILSAAINVSTIPAIAAESMSIRKSGVASWETAVSQSTDVGDTEKSCRDYAASFHESVMRQVAARLAGGGRTLIVLDTVIDGFNDLFATRCGDFRQRQPARAR